MNTTELFVEQVLAGLLVLLTGGLVFYWQLLEVYREYVGQDYLEPIITGGFVLGASYLIGMVYDRVADTLLQDLESHCRLKFAFGNRDPEHVDEYGVPTRDPFEDGNYRIVVLGNPQATEHMSYLRSRIRLTRAMTVAIPGLMMALLLALDGRRTSRWWGTMALMIPLVYLAILTLKVIRRRRLFQRPPKTFDLDKLGDYYIRRARMLPKRCDGQDRVMWVLFYDEVWLGLLLLLGFASFLIISTRSYGRFWIPAIGLLLTLIVGWVWWRISVTFYAFLRDYNKYTTDQ